MKQLKDVIHSIFSQWSVNCTLNKAVINPEDTESVLSGAGEGSGESEEPFPIRILWSIFPSCWQPVSSERLCSGTSRHRAKESGTGRPLIGWLEDWPVCKDHKFWLQGPHSQTAKSNLNPFAGSCILNLASEDGLTNFSSETLAPYSSTKCS